jgi:enoyl-CoA hydratase/carnithine racemase
MTSVAQLTLLSNCVDLVLRDLDQGVLLLTLNRPERNNAWNMELEEAYFAALTDAAADPETRVIVVTGAGKSFCPGIDMQILAAATEGERASDVPRLPMTFARFVPKPVIAAINGACAGIGVVQACAADLRFAARGAKLATSFARRGLPAENALSWILPRMIGTGAAMDLLMSGRTISAEEAHSLGLIDRLYDRDELLAETLSYARDVAQNCSPRSMAVIKEQVLADWERGAEESRRVAVRLLEQMRDQDDMREGTRSFMEKRPPQFEGLSARIAPERDEALGQR